MAERDETSDMSETDERELEREHAPLFAVLAARRGDCPQLERLIDEDLEALPEVRRLEIEEHLELCPTCARIVEQVEPREVDDLQWRRIEGRLDRRHKPWLELEPALAGRPSGRRLRPLLAIAAALLVGLGAIAVWLQSRPAGPVGNRDGSTREVSPVRGAAIQILEPVGRVTSVERFSWRIALPLDLRYRVEIRDGDRLVTEIETVESSLDLDEGQKQALETGRIYRWRVVGLDADGRVLAASDWVELEP